MSSVIRDIVVRYKLFDKVIEQIVIPEDDVFRLISENFQARDIIKRYLIDSIKNSNLPLKII